MHKHFRTLARPADSRRSCMMRPVDVMPRFAPAEPAWTTIAWRHIQIARSARTRSISCMRIYRGLANYAQLPCWLLLLAAEVKVR